MGGPAPEADIAGTLCTVSTHYLLEGFFFDFLFLSCSTPCHDLSGRTCCPEWPSIGQYLPLLHRLQLSFGGCSIFLVSRPYFLRGTNVTYYWRQIAFTQCEEAQSIMLCGPIVEMRESVSICLWAQVESAMPKMEIDSENCLRMVAGKSKIGSVILGDVAQSFIRALKPSDPPVLQSELDSTNSVGRFQQVPLELKCPSNQSLIGASAFLQNVF